MPFIVGYILLHIYHYPFGSSYHFSADPIKQHLTFFEKQNRLVGKMWSSFRWIVKLVKFIRADSWGSDESKHETLLGDDCGGGRFDLWNRKGGVELSLGVDERKDIQSLPCHHKLSTTHLGSGLRPFCLFSSFDTKFTHQHQLQRIIFMHMHMQSFSEKSYKIQNECLLLTILYFLSFATLWYRQFW